MSIAAELRALAAGEAAPAAPENVIVPAVLLATPVLQAVKVEAESVVV